MQVPNISTDRRYMSGRVVDRRVPACEPEGRKVGIDSNDVPSDALESNKVAADAAAEVCDHLKVSEPRSGLPRCLLR